MPIEVLALASAVSTVAGSISTAITAGKDMSDLLPRFAKLGELDAAIQAAEQGKHKGPLGRLSSSQAEGLEIATAKLKYKEAMTQLESTCRLFGPVGFWDSVVAEMSAARKRQKDALEEEMRRRDRLFWAISIICGVIIFLAGVSLMIYGATFLR